MSSKVLSQLKLRQAVQLSGSKKLILPDITEDVSLTQYTCDIVLMLCFFTFWSHLTNCTFKYRNNPNCPETSTLWNSKISRQHSTTFHLMSSLFRLLFIIQWFKENNNNLLLIVWVARLSKALYTEKVDLLCQEKGKKRKKKK